MIAISENVPVGCQQQQCIIDKSRKPNDDAILPISKSLTMQLSELYQIPLNLINCSFGIVRTQDQPTTLQSIVKSQRKATGVDAVVVFAVRTPGCAACREHGVQLSEWVSKYSKLSKKHPSVSLIGIVKESGTPATDEALLNFYQDYFHHPICQDSKWQVYQALGGRKLSIWKVLCRLRKARQRWASKNIINQPQGEVWMQGGVLVFDKRGDLQHVMYEKFSKMFDTEALDVVVHNIKQQYNRSSTASQMSKETTQSDSLPY
jgi:hypothetical protein